MDTGIDALIQQICKRLGSDDYFRYSLKVLSEELKGIERADPGGLFSHNDLADGIAHWLRSKIDDGDVNDIMGKYYDDLFDVDPPDGWDYREPRY